MKTRTDQLSLLNTPVSADDLLHQANLLFQKGLFSEAEEFYRRSVLENPQSHKALLGAALAAFQQGNMLDAIQFMQQAVEIAPNMALYRRNLGELLRRIGQFQAAIDSHQIAVTLEPHNAENYFLLGLSYHDNQQFGVAIRYYHAALSYDHYYGQAWNNLGASLERMGDRQTAKIAYTTAISLNPKHAEAHNNLGAIYSEEGRFEEAHTHFIDAITAAPDFVDAHYNLSLIKTYALDDPHLVLLESMMSKIDQYPLQTRVRYFFALGKMLDGAKQYTRAFKAYAEGNRLHYSQQPWDKTKLQELVAQIPQVFMPSFLKRPPITEELRCPIFIVGMPRAGTTLIEQILASHESIHGAGEVTILSDVIQEAYVTTNQSFNAWAAQLTDQEFALLGEKYLERTWKLAPGKQFIVDKMPANCFYIGMIYRMLPTAKIIHAMRDPMDSCFSCFTHLFKGNMPFAYDLTALGNYYHLYAQTMQYWQSVLPQDVIFNLSYEEMVANHEACSKQLLDYIGLPWDPNCLTFYENKRAVQTASVSQVRQPIYKTSVQRWQHFAKELTPLLQLVAAYRTKGRVTHDNNRLCNAGSYSITG